MSRNIKQKEISIVIFLLYPFLLETCEALDTIRKTAAHCSSTHPINSHKTLERLLVHLHMEPF